MRRGNIFIGTSGWNYPHWGKGVFYPPAIKAKDWLSYYAQHFNTVEINNTFYRLPSPAVFERWEHSVPHHFRFAVKVNRFLTHIKKLNQLEQPLAKFLEHTSLLAKKLTTLLFQLPPFLKVQPQRLAHLLNYLTYQTIIPGVRVVVELRNPTWLTEEIFHLLKQKEAALCFTDWPDLTITDPVTTDFVYLRRHGSKQLYSSSYSKKEIENDAQRIQIWLAEGKDVYIYYNNDAMGLAIRNALELKNVLTCIKGKGGVHA